MTSLLKGSKPQTFGTAIAAVAAIGCVGFNANTASAVHLDFDTDAAGNPIVAGQIIDDEYAAWGVTVKTFANNRNFNLGIAFDSENPTGGDVDLGTGSAAFANNLPGQGNILIISENNQNNNGFVSTPDDNRTGGYHEFLFDEVQAGATLTVLDNEDPSDEFRFYLDGVLQLNFELAGTVNNGAEIYSFDNIKFDKFKYIVVGSGGLADAKFDAVPEPVTATLALMGVSALGVSTLRRPRKA